MMYSKSGEGKMAKTYEEHLSLKNKGWGHSKPKNKKKKSIFPPKYFIGALISGIKGTKKSKEQEAKAEADRKAQLAKEESLRQNRQKLQMSPEIEKMKEGLGGSEINRRQEAAERTRAGAMAAATRGGSRVDPFAAARAGAAQESALASEQAAAKRKGMEASLAERGKLRGIQEDREKSDLARQAQMADYAREDIQAAQANTAAYQQQTYGAIDAGITTFAGSDKKLKKNIKKVGKTKSGVPVSEFEYKDKEDAPKGPGKYKGVIAQDLIGTKHEGAVGKLDKNTLGVNYRGLDVKLGKISKGKLKDKVKKKKKTPIIRKYSGGGVDAGAVLRQQGFKKGGMQEVPAEQPEVTPGKFSHTDNPIDLIQKEGTNGSPEKIGEMTGGEAIVPPKNVKQMRKMIKNNDGEALVNLMDNLLTKWDREAEENEESRKVFEKTKKAHKGSMVRTRGARHQGVRRPRLSIGKGKFKHRRNSIF